MAWWEHEDDESHLVARKNKRSYGWIRKLRGDRGLLTFEAWAIGAYESKAFATEEEAERWVLDQLDAVRGDLAELPKLYGG